MNLLGWQADGLEPDPMAVEIAKGNGLRVNHGTIENTEMNEQYYDAITLSHVMEHFQSPRVALRKMAKWLKPGGVLVSISPNPIGLISKLFLDKWYALDAARHLVLPSPKGYRLMCEEFGLTAKCRTSMQVSFWVLRESLSIRRTGKLAQCEARIIPSVFSILGSCAIPVFGNIGEEVICFATKK